MAFENVLISKENDEKYGLTSIFLKYNPSDRQGVLLLAYGEWLFQ